MGLESVLGDSGMSNSIVGLNVGGQHFATSEGTLMREAESMLGRLVCSHIRTATDSEGRIFIDRDPKHFRIILNYLRDGACQLPAEQSEIHELLQEVDFYQLTAMKAFILGEEYSPLSASHLRYCIIHQIQEDSQLRDVLDLLIECAFGRETERIPTKRSRVEILVKESAFNPLSTSNSVNSTPSRDETLYVGFQQDLRFQGKGRRHSVKRKHESTFLHENDYLSYDHKLYGGTQEERMHIKAVDVYRYHCIHQLPEDQRRLRDAAVYIEANADAVQWGLELEGYKDVRLAIHARQTEAYDAPDSPPSSPTHKQKSTHLPLLCHISIDVHLSL